MGFVNCKNAAQFPFMQPKNTSLVPNTTPFIEFACYKTVEHGRSLTSAVASLQRRLSKPPGGS